MSWDEINTQKYECPCHSSTYTIKYLMDDWNRSDEQWEMNCPECRQKHRLHTYYYQYKGMTCKAHRWITKEAHEKVSNIETKYNRMKDQIVALAGSRYLDKWLSYFDGAKSKKDVWRWLTDNGARYPSLSTFYAHLKNDNLEKYLRKEFDFENLQMILSKLNANDNDVNKMLKIINEVKDELDKARDKLIKAGYR